MGRGFPLPLFFEGFLPGSCCFIEEVWRMEDWSDLEKLAEKLSTLAQEFEVQCKQVLDEEQFEKELEEIIKGLKARLEDDSYQEEWVKIHDELMYREKQLRELTQTK